MSVSVFVYQSISIKKCLYIIASFISVLSVSIRHESNEKLLSWNLNKDAVKGHEQGYI
jgi:hypothetical protein